MALIARILLVSLIAAGVGAILAFALFGQLRDASFAALLLGSVGAIIGAIAAATRDIVSARKPDA